jgi:predicted site-specific integrase-resolvase
MLIIKDVARHWKLCPETIRKWISQGDIPAARLNRRYRLRWEDVWACERGPMPRGRARTRYMKPLLTKDELGALYGVSARTVERWVNRGLPTRNVFGSVRINADDAAGWLAARMAFRPRKTRVARR